VRLKVEKAEMLARRIIEQEEEDSEREQQEKEKGELPSLVNMAIDWAREHGLKKLTFGDVEAFLAEKNIDPLRQTKRQIYSMANVHLKSRF
jgi:hypothetical protein